MEYMVIGKSTPRVDAIDKVLGKTRYASDFMTEGMCYGKFFRSSVPHAKITKLDVSKAEKLAGVQTVVIPQDAPPTRLGMLIFDRYLLPRDGVVKYIGEPIAAVVADTEEIAQEALDLIEVEYEELPAVFELEEAMKEKPSNVVHPDLQNYVDLGVLCKVLREPHIPNNANHYSISSGDLDKGFAEADIIVENEYSMPRISHCHPETHDCIAWWDSNGDVTIVESTQGVHVDRILVSFYYGLPLSKVRVIGPFNGSGFGGKLMGPLIGIVPLLAKKAGRPVKVAFTREEQFAFGRPQWINSTHIKDGVTKDGKIVARQITWKQDVGAYVQLAVHVTQNASFGALGLYNIPNFQYDGYAIYTNNPPAGSLRGYGTAEMAWPIEQQMDLIAEKLKMDPAEVRRRNFLKEGDIDITGSDVHSIGIADALEQTLTEIEWGKEENGEYPWKIGKGISAAAKYTLAKTRDNALVKVKSDATIEVYQSGDEMGQGLDTVLSQIAAEEFKTSVDKVKIIRADTSITPYNAGSLSSRSTSHTGTAVKNACDEVKKKLFEAAAPMLGTTYSDLEIKDGKIFISRQPDKFIQISQLFSFDGVALGRNAEFIAQGTFYAPTDRSTSCYTYVAVGIKVAVNIKTGMVKLLKLVEAADCGRPINPKMCEQQIEGGLIQGVGSALFEELILRDGIVVNPNYMDYKIPLFTDIPPVKDIVPIIATCFYKDGAYGAKGIGEGTNVAVAPAIANAVYNAVGIRIKDLPISREKVFWEIKSKGKI